MSWRNVWVDAGNGPNYDNGGKNGITGYFMPLGDARTTRAQLQEIHNRGLADGCYVGHNWYGDGNRAADGSPNPAISPGQYAAKVKSLFDPVRIPSTRLQVNMEQHDPLYIRAALAALRAIYPTVGLSWAFEGMQGGWIGSASGFVAALVALKVRFVPEAFGDPGMYRRESDMVLRDLLHAGVPEQSVSMFLDGRAIGAGAEGYVFTQGRLPIL